MNKQKKFFNPANTLSPFEESLQEKRHTFIAMLSLFTYFNMQILNFYDDDDDDIGMFTALSNI